MRKYNEEERAYRAGIAERYMSLPCRERGAYADGLGISRATMYNWIHKYTDGVRKPAKPVVEKPKEPEVVKVEAETAPKPKKGRPVKRPDYIIGDIRMVDGMRVMRVKLEDLAGGREPKWVSAVADFQNGKPSDRTCGMLESQAADIVGAWGYEVPEQGAFGELIRRAWAR